MLTESVLSMLSVVHGVPFFTRGTLYSRWGSHEISSFVHLISRINIGFRMQDARVEASGSEFRVPPGGGGGR